MAADHTVAIFIAEIILLLLVGRLLGEGMSRIGQPAIFGQLLAGVVLGPSVLGAISPAFHQLIFPDDHTVKSMLNGVSQVGILLLLLLTGMETNLSLVSRKRRAVISTSLFGIAVPFVCGVALTYALPSGLIPDPATRLVTALFVGTALSISSVKIVAMVLMEVGAIRRDLGQLILATAILDDTVAWVMIAVISGIAIYGGVSFTSIAMSLAGTLLFLAISLTVGQRAVAWLIRWTNDNMTIEFPVITGILVIMLLMALSTELIGVHTALGAFVAGTLIAQSPILTEHIEDALRGFIIAFFSPIFFGIAGLGMDLTTLSNPALLGFTLVIIATASIGKFLGALVGGRLGGLTSLESIALATGLNARGSTEVIIASIGLSIGALSNQLYTMIVAMAVVTTMAMPPTLRWVFAKVPLRPDEAARLEKEEAEEQQSVPNMERVLVYADDSPNGRLATQIAKTFATEEQVLTTILTSGTTASVANAGPPPAIAIQQQPTTAAPPAGSDELFAVKAAAAPDALEKEATKGYSIVFIGLDEPISQSGQRFHDQLQRLVETFDGPVAIAINGTGGTKQTSLTNILVPSGGQSHARLATEVALALAKASSGKMTVLHVHDPDADTDLLRGRARRLGMSVLVDARRLGKRSGVPVEALTTVDARPERSIGRIATSDRFDLVVLGAAFRLGQRKFLGPRSAALVRDIKLPMLLVVR